MVPTEQSDLQFDLREVESRIYELSVDTHLTRRIIDAALDDIWSRPDWGQPWGLVVRVTPRVTYDSDIRTTPVPPDDRRAVGAAIVTPKAMHRVVISTIALALRISSQFLLSAHEERDDALRQISKAVQATRQAGKPF